MLPLPGDFASKIINVVENGGRTLVSLCCDGLCLFAAMDVTTFTAAVNDGDDCVDCSSYCPSSCCEGLDAVTFHELPYAACVLGCPETLSSYRSLGYCCYYGLVPLLDSTEKDDLSLCASLFYDLLN